MISTMIVCDICRTRSAQFLQHHTRKRVCKTCFENDIVSRVRDTIKRFNMISEGDKILVAVSGGKDSLTLLDILANLIDNNKLVALSIIEGISGYNREADIASVRRITRMYGIDYLVVSLRDFIGYSVDDFMYAQQKLKIRSPLSACTFCGIARRRVMNSIAREIGATKIATGHNLDDEIQTYIINILRGDIVRLIQSHPLSTPHSHSLVKRIKPLRYVYEYETTIYAYIKGFHFQDTECPYINQRPTLRAKIRSMLVEIESKSPGILLNLIRYLDTVIEPLVLKYQRESITLPQCIKCGEPTSPKRTVCKFCTLVDLIIQAIKVREHC